MTDKKRDWQSHFLINSDIITYILHHYELVRGKSLIFSLSSSSIISETTHWFPTIYDLNDFLNIRFTGFPQNVCVSSLLSSIIFLPTLHRPFEFESDGHTFSTFFFCYTMPMSKICPFLIVVSFWDQDWSRYSYKFPLFYDQFLPKETQYSFSSFIFVLFARAG